MGSGSTLLPDPAWTSARLHHLEGQEQRKPSCSSTRPHNRWGAPALGLHCSLCHRSRSQATNQFLTVNFSCSSISVVVHLLHVCLLFLVSIVQSVFFCYDSSTADSFNNDKQPANEIAKGRTETLAIRLDLGAEPITADKQQRQRRHLFFDSGKCKRANASGVWQALGWHK